MNNRRRKRKLPVIIHEGIAIREVRPAYWQVDVMRNGKRERTCFRDLEHAKTHASALAIKIGNEGASALDLSQVERADATAALRALSGKASLHAAAAFYMRHNAAGDSLSVEQLGEKWLAALRAQGCRETTLHERSGKVERLCAALGDRPAMSITKADLESFMDARGVKGVTRDGYRRAYRAMFQFAAEENIIEGNPAAGIRAVRMDERLPTPFTVKDTEAILRAAEQLAPAMVIPLAVGFFAGLRPGEVAGLKWEDIDHAQHFIRVRPEVSKVRRTRNVPIVSPLSAWLAVYRKAAGPISPAQGRSDYLMFKMKRDQVKGGIIGAAGVKWIKDGPRKTFASHHYARHNDAATLAAILGHTGGHDVLFRHYRGLVTARDGRAYFKIVPGAMVKAKTAKERKAVSA